MIVLASASPRRLELLRLARYKLRVDPADIDEQWAAGLRPAEQALRLARDKALRVAARWPGATVIGADTIVVLGEELLGKPRDLDEARRMIGRLSGITHEVITGFYIRPGDVQRAPIAEAVHTEVTFRCLPPAEIEHYLAEGEWRGKAGGYAVQRGAASFVKTLRGSYTNVMGLPLAETVEALKALGEEPA